MIPSLPSPLPPLPHLDRALLRLTRIVVPAADQADWLRSWRAELWHRHHPRSQASRPGTSRSAADLYPGLVSDAIWLRAECLRQALTGTALLCIASLACLLLFSALPLLVSLGGVRDLIAFASSHATLFLSEAALVAFVSYATSARSIEHTSREGAFSQFRVQLFLASKLSLVLLTAFVLSMDLAQPLHAAHPFISELLQPQFFVLMALVGQRWNFRDQDNRCKHCLRSLSTPARVGRPSWNFLDSNGTELLCKDGHGLLSIPEIETSWRPSSRWIAA